MGFICLPDLNPGFGLFWAYTPRLYTILRCRKQRDVIDEVTWPRQTLNPTQQLSEYNFSRNEL